jgi:hypothetical protein
MPSIRVREPRIVNTDGLAVEPTFGRYPVLTEVQDGENAAQGFDSATAVESPRTPPNSAQTTLRRVFGPSGFRQYDDVTATHADLAPREIQRVPLRIESSLPNFDVGVPVIATDQARFALAQLPPRAVNRVMKGISAWISEFGRARSAHLSVFADPEVPNWEEVLVEILTDTSGDETLGLWDKLGVSLDEAISDLPADERRRIAEHLGIHLIGADEQP